MTSMEDRVHDTWSPLDFILENLSRRPGRTWLDEVDTRRLNAYTVLAGYRDNIRARYLPDAQGSRIVNVDGVIHNTSQDTSHYREYGDADLLITTTRALVLGETQEVEPAERTPAWATTFWESWVESERWAQKLLTGEAHTCTYGDGVYVLTPSPSKQRPRLRVYDPGFYFPDTTTRVEGWEDEDYPPIVHLAWEYEDRQHHRWIRRTTWRMVPLEAAVSRPWGGATAWTCMYRQVDYRLDTLREGADVYSPELATTSVVLQDWTDLGIDFIPVVHVPNTPTEWGESIMLRVGQLLDDVQNTDTDLAIASQHASSTLVTEGAAPALTGAPGEILGMPAGTDAKWLDTSRNLDALLKFAQHLADRLLQNTRLSKALVGAIQPNDVPSGYALQLGFHAARQLMRELRTVREEKHPLVLKFALRMAQAYGWVQPGEVPAPTVVFGASLPSDLASAVSLVKDLLPIHGISTLTAVQILVEAGVPIDKAEDEVRRIEQESTKRALELFEATGNAQAAAALLGVATPVVAPPVV